MSSRQPNNYRDYIEYANKFLHLNSEQGTSTGIQNVEQGNRISTMDKMRDSDKDGKVCVNGRIHPNPISSSILNKAIEKEGFRFFVEPDPVEDITGENQETDVFKPEQNRANVVHDNNNEDQPGEFYVEDEEIKKMEERLQLLQALKNKERKLKQKQALARQIKQEEEEIALLQKSMFEQDEGSSMATQYSSLQRVTEDLHVKKKSMDARIYKKQPMIEDHRKGKEESDSGLFDMNDLDSFHSKQRSTDDVAFDSLASQTSKPVSLPQNEEITKSMLQLPATQGNNVSHTTFNFQGPVNGATFNVAGHHY